MSISAALVLLTAFAFVVGQLLNRWLSRFVSLSGAEYLVVGVLMGPHMGFGLLSEHALATLQPLVSLLLGVVGFVIGIHARRALARRENTLVGLLSSVGVTLLCTVVLVTVLGLLGFDAPSQQWHLTLAAVGDYQLELYASGQLLWPSVAIASTACVVSPTVILSTCRRLHSRGPVGGALRAIADASQVVGICVLGLGLAAVRATGEANRFGIGVAEWALAAVAASVVCGLLFTLFIGRENDPSRVFLASIGAVTFAAGLGASLGIAPLFVTLVAGMTVAATSPHADALGEQLERLRHPLFVMILLLCGAYWVPAEPLLWSLVPLVVLLRYAAFSLLAGGLLRSVPEEPLRVPRIASGLLAQGTLAPAMALNFALIFPELGSVVLTVVLAGTLINDLWSLRGIERLLVDAQEGPVPEVSVPTQEEQS